MSVSRTETIQERRIRMAQKLGTARADHNWESREDGSCKACPALSPFRWERVAHRYIIEEEPF